MRRSWGALHALAECGGFALTPLFEAVSFVGEKGACFFALAFVLMVFKRTRRAGTVMFVAICLGALATPVLPCDAGGRSRRSLPPSSRRAHSLHFGLSAA